MQSPISGTTPATAANATVIIENLHRSYRSKKATVEALRDISFTVDKGEIFGVIGPDGAGKTTLFRILTTLLLANKGHASVAGFDTVKDYVHVRRCVGYMPGRFSLYQDLSVRENLEFFAAIFKADIQRNYHLIKDIYDQLLPFESRKAGQLSGGMKQKLALSCALIHEPLVLFLDEPTTGVDAVSRKEFWEMLHRLKQEGITILVSTSYMDEAALCDRIALLQNGSVLAIDTPASIRKNFGKSLWAVKAADMYRLLNELKARPFVESCHPFGQYLHVVLKDQADHHSLDDFLKTANLENLEVKPIEPNMEDCFMALMQTPPKQ